MVNNSSRKRLTIAEDTACVPSKTSYVEDGMDKNGIYYFGKKPDLPKNWRDYKKGRKGMKDSGINRDITESVDSETVSGKLVTLDTFDTEDGTVSFCAYMLDGGTEIEYFVFMLNDEQNGTQAEIERFNELSDAIECMSEMQGIEDDDCDDWFDLDDYDYDDDWDDEWGDDEDDDDSEIDYGYKEDDDFQDWE